MAETPSFFLRPITLGKRRTGPPVLLDIYTDAGSPVAIASDDHLRAKIWATDDAAPAIDAELGGSPSKVEVVNLGDSSTPARIRVTFHETDTASLVPGTPYKFELILVDHSESDVNVTLCRGPVEVEGTATGDVGP